MFELIFYSYEVLSLTILCMSEIRDSFAAVSVNVLLYYLDFNIIFQVTICLMMI